MEVVIKKDVLVQALNDISRITSKCGKIYPHNFKITVNKDSITLYSYNFYDGAPHTLDVTIHNGINIIKKGEIYTNESKRCLKFCKEADSRYYINIKSYDDDHVKFSCNNESAKFETMDADTCFEFLDKPSKQDTLTVNGQDFKAILDSGAHAIAKDDIRNYFNGMLFELDGKSMFTVATDGHRLAKSKSIDIHGNKDKRSMIVPRGAILELRKMLRNKKDYKVSIVPYTQNDSHSYIDIRYTDHKYNFDYNFSIVLLYAKYPDYERVMPAKVDKPIIINVKDSLKKLKAMLSDLDKDTQRIVIDYDDTRLFFVNTEDELELKRYTVVNIKYLIDTLKAITTSEVAVHLVNYDDVPNTGILFEPVPADGNTFVMMPMRK